MTTIFISHSTKDKEITDRIIGFLRSLKIDAFFLDYDPVSGVPAGADWETILHQRLEAARALVFIATKNSMESKWCFHELATCRARGIDIFPLTFGGDVGFEQAFADIQYLKFDDDWPKFLSRFQSALERKGYTTETLHPWDAAKKRERGPFPGLEAFDVDDAAVFFGRDRELLDFSRLLLRKRQNPRGSVIAISGTSGVGKSSFLKAGVYARLNRNADEWLCTKPIRAGSSLLGELLGEIDRLAGQDTAHDRAPNVHAYGGPGLPALVESAARALEAIPDGAIKKKPIVFFVDQAEQLGALDENSVLDGFASFFNVLNRRLDRQLFVIMTVRSDRMATLQTAILRGQGDFEVFFLPPIDPSQIPDLIERPCHVHGLIMEAALARTLVQEIGNQIELLPLLSYVLRLLYENRSQDNQLTLASYKNTVGSIGNSIGRIAELLFRPYIRDESEIRKSLIQLASSRGSSGFIARDVAFEEMPVRARPFIESMIENRLLRSADVRSDETYTSEEGEGRIRVSHEILFTTWPRYEKWLHEEHEVLQLRSSVDEAARLWIDNPQSPDDYLAHTGGRLLQLRALIDEGKLVLDQQISRRYFAACLAGQERRNRRRRNMVVGAFTALAATAVVFFFLYRDSQFNLLNSRHNLGLSRLAEAKKYLADDYPTRAFLLAASSVGEMEYTDGKVAETLLRHGSDEFTEAKTVAALLRRTYRLPLASVHQKLPVASVSYSPDGRHVASGSRDGYLRLYDAGSLALVREIRGHTEQVNRVIFSANGNAVYSAGFDGKIGVWNIVTNELAHLEGGHTSFVSDIRLDSAMRKLISVGADSRIVVWDLASGTFAHPLSLPAGWGTSVDLSPDGKLVAVTSDDGMLFIYRSVDWSLAAPPVKAHKEAAANVTFNRTGTLIATAGFDESAKIWTLSGLLEGSHDGPAAILAGHKHKLWRVQFLPQRRQIATAGWDGSIVFWNADSYMPEGRIDAHNSWVYDFSVAADGGQLATASEDGFLRTWSIKDLGGTTHSLSVDHLEVLTARISPLNRHMLTGGRGKVASLWRLGAGGGRTTKVCDMRHSNWVQAVAFDQSGRFMATGQHSSADDPITVSIWRREDCALHRGLPVGTAGVGSVAFNPKGTVLASAGRDGTVQLFDTQTGDRLVSRKIHEGVVNAVVFTRDGKRVVTGGNDGKIFVLSAPDLQVVHEVLHHKAPVLSVDVDRDDRLVASGGEDRRIYIWDLDVPERHVQRLASPGNSLTFVGFTQGAKELVTGGDAAKVEIWDIASGHRTFALDTLVGVRGALDVSSDGKFLLVDGGKGILRVIDLSAPPKAPLDRSKFQLRGARVQFH